MYRCLDTYPMRSIGMASCLTSRITVTIIGTITTATSIGITARRYTIGGGCRVMCPTITGTILVLRDAVFRSTWDSKTGDPVIADGSEPAAIFRAVMPERWLFLFPGGFFCCKQGQSGVESRKVLGY